MTRHKYYNKINALRYYINADEVANNIMNILRSNRYSRDEPTLENVIKERIKELMFSRINFEQGFGDNEHNLHLVGLWGGSKEVYNNKADGADIRTLDYLCELRSEISHVKIGEEKFLRHCHLDSSPHLSLLFCDLHHIVANGRESDESHHYFWSLKKLTDERNIDLIKLSDIYKIAQFSDYYIPLEHISDIDSRIAAAEIMAKNEAAKEKLIKAAKNHSLWIIKKEGFKPEDIAKLYVEMEIRFLKMIKESKKHELTAYFSFSDPDIQKPIAEAANVPMLYLHSSGKGHHECPWYCPGIPQP